MTEVTVERKATVTIKIKGQEIELSEQEAKELRDSLSTALADSGLWDFMRLQRELKEAQPVERFIPLPYPVNPPLYPQPWWSQEVIVTC